MDWTDQPRPVRPGEELDAGKIESFLKQALPDLAGGLTVRQFPGGHSNLTYLLTVGDRELVLRRPPFGTKAKTAHDMGREYRILSALQDVFPYCPRPLAYTEDPSVIGGPFYVMERIKGVIIRKDLPVGLNLSPADLHRLFERLLNVHVELHSIDYRAVGLKDFGRPEGYVRRQVEGWSGRYRAARTPDAPDGEEVMAWLAAHLPPDTPRPAVIHNDFRLDNAVLDPNDLLRIIGILDWEMATIGDPLMDLGGSLAYWIQAGDPEEMQVIRFMPTHLPGAPTRAEIVDLYARKTNRSIDNFDFYYVFGLFRLAVIAQQIYYRFYHGQTQDQRFQTMIFGAKVLEKQARRVMAGSGV
ncbi:MAG: phosphotransferase family protein [Thermodesulfobacteriota bacterium]